MKGRLTPKTEHPRSPFTPLQKIAVTTALLPAELHWFIDRERFLMKRLSFVKSFERLLMKRVSFVVSHFRSVAMHTSKNGGDAGASGDAKGKQGVRSRLRDPVFLHPLRLISSWWLRPRQKLVPQPPFFLFPQHYTHFCSAPGRRSTTSTQVCHPNKPLVLPSSGLAAFLLT